MKKQTIGFSILIGAMLILGTGSVSAQAAIIDSYADQLCGHWYIDRTGIVIDIKKYDENYLMMTANGLSTDHEAYYTKDTEENGREYLLREDTEDPRFWDSYDGRIHIEQFEDEAFWVYLKDIEPDSPYYDSFFGSGNIFSVVPLMQDTEKKDKALLNTQVFYGHWKSKKGTYLYARPIFSSEDIYSSLDYLIMIYSISPDNNGFEEIETKLLREYEDKNLSNYNFVMDDHFQTHYVLSSIHTFEEQDYNDMIIDEYARIDFEAPTGLKSDISLDDPENLKNVFALVEKAAVNKLFALFTEGQ